MANLKTTTYLAADLDAVRRARAYERELQVGTTDRGMSAPHFGFVGVGDWTKSASHDPADTVLLDMAVEEWLHAGFSVADLKDAHDLNNERYLAR